MSEWNYAEVISALITSPQPLMLFRSIKTIKVQTSSADKTAVQQRNTAGWLLRSRGLSLAEREGRKKKRQKVEEKKKKRKTLNLFEVVICTWNLWFHLLKKKKGKQVERSVQILVRQKKICV